MIIKVFGTGCANCKSQYEAVKEAVESLNIECDVQKIEDLVQIAEYAIVSTPAIAIDDNVVSQGTTLTKEQVVELISKFNKPKCSCGGCC